MPNDQVSLQYPLILEYRPLYPVSESHNLTQLYAVMLKADGKDITKRSSARRNRYLLVFNCQLAPAAAGRLGTLAKLDTKNPVMYIDFPEGRLRLRGTLIFPKNKYIVLRLGKEALCEDVLESMIVFSESHWVGTEAENPNEDELPMPESLKTTQRHANIDFGGRGNTNNNTMQTGTNELDYEETQEEDMGDAVAGAAGGGGYSQEQGSQPPSQRRGSRRAVATGKRARYAEDSDASFGDDDDDDGDGDSDGEPAPRKLPRVASGTGAAAVRRLPPAAGKAVTKSAPKTDKGAKPQSHVIINLTGDSSDDEDQPLVARGKQSTLATFVQKRNSIGKKATPQAKRAKSTSQKSASEEDDEVIDLASLSSDEEEDEEDAGGSLPASQRPRRAAAGVASQKLRDTEDEEEEASEDGGDTNDDDEEEESDAVAPDASEEEFEEGDASDEDSDGYAPSE